MGRESLVVTCLSFCCWDQIVGPEPLGLVGPAGQLVLGCIGWWGEEERKGGALLPRHPLGIANNEISGSFRGAS